MPRISAKDARLLVEDLETGRGRAKEVAMRNPWLIEMSQEVLAERCGRRVFPVFRSLVTAEGDGLQGEGVVSTTLRPRYALKLACDAPAMVFTSHTTLKMEPSLLRYEVAPERVALYMPLVTKMLREQRGSLLRTMAIETRWGERMKGIEVIEAVERLDEEEVIVDVEGLTPRRLAVPQHVAGCSAWAPILRGAEIDSPFELSYQLADAYFELAQGACGDW